MWGFFLRPFFCILAIMISTAILYFVKIKLPIFLYDMGYDFTTAKFLTSSIYFLVMFLIFLVILYLFNKFFGEE